MKRLFAIVFAMVFVTAVCDAKDYVKTNALANWSIVAFEDAIPSEKYAAQEFQRLLKDVTGITLPITSQVSDSAGVIFIGYNEEMAASEVGFSIDDLGEEGLRIHIASNQIAIAGGRPRGTLYGVYEFMERYFDVRFLTHDHTYIPSKKTTRIPCETFTYIPPFTFRWSYYKENAAYQDFAAKLRVNTTTIDEKLGGKTNQELINHSFHHLLSVEEYGKTHPEYFALVDGERKLDMWGGGPELCVTNPDVVEIVANKVIQELDANPNRQNYSVSQNDNDKYCRCKRCEEINQREGTPMGSHLAFVNAVAERVEAKHPDVKIGTLSYWYTRKPPKTIRPRDNVQIQLCSIECSTLYALDDPDSEKNREFCDDMNRWGAMCDDIWIWNYNTNFRYYDLPFPNLRVISPNIQYFVKNHVKGLFMQANGNSMTGEMCDLRNYVISRCMWNPELDSWELAKEFCQLHYGKAAKTVFAYLDFLHDNAERAGYEPGCFPNPYELGLNAEVSTKIFNYFQKALTQAENEEVFKRIEKASICAWRAVLETCGEMQINDGKLTVRYPAPFEDAVEKYKELTKKYGQERAEEWEPIDNYYSLLDRATKEGFKAAKLENDQWSLPVIAEKNGMIVDLFYKPKKRYLTGNFADRSLRLLFDRCTIEEQGVKGFQDAPEEFEYESSQDAVVLNKKLADGSVYTRQICFDAEHPNQVVFKTEIAHNGAEPKTYQIQITPEFHSGEATSNSKIVSAYIYDDGWRLFNEGWKDSDGPGKEALRNATGGEYAFFNHKQRYGVKLSYDSEHVYAQSLYWNPHYPLATLGLMTKDVELKSGGHFSFEYRMEYLSRRPR